MLDLVISLTRGIITELRSAEVSGLAHAASEIKVFDTHDLVAKLHAVTETFIRAHQYGILPNAAVCCVDVSHTGDSLHFFKEYIILFRDRQWYAKVATSADLCTRMFALYDTISGRELFRLAVNFGSAGGFGSMHINEFFYFGDSLLREDQSSFFYHYTIASISEVFSRFLDSLFV
jgi:hypothetical protein